MNHLRELLDALPYKVGFTDVWSRGIAEEAFTETKRSGERAVCFDIGDVDRAVTLTVIPELCKLPYPTCWFEQEFKLAEDSNKRVRVGMMCSEHSGSMHAVVFLREPGGVWSAAGAVTAENMGMRYTDMHYYAHAEEARGMGAMMYGTQAFLSALHCSNVRRHEHVPDAKLQKARAKRGKAPLFSYWTLQLDGKSERSESRGGSHASPRVHLRRGHPRQFAPGRWTWVQPCAVGNRAAGVVHKDYCARAAAV